MINRYLIWLEVLWFWSNVFLSWLKVFLIWLKVFLIWLKVFLIWLEMFFDLLKVVFDMFECTLYFYWKSFNFASQKLLKETACVRNSNVPKLFVPYNLALTHRLLLIYQCWSLSIKKSASGCYSTCKYLSGVPQTEHGKFAISQGL